MIPANILVENLIKNTQKQHFFCNKLNLYLNLQTRVCKMHPFNTFQNMILYTSETESTARNYNLEPKDVIFLYAIAGGAPLADAARVIYNIKEIYTAEKCEQKAKQFVKDHPGAAVLLNRIKNNKSIKPTKKELEDIKNKTQKEGEGDNNKDEYTTRAGLVSKIITEVRECSGKDAISGLQTLAKMQGLDKPDEETIEDARKFFLPWVSSCKSCNLMRLFREISEKGG